MNKDNISHVTFTGAEDHTVISQLEELSDQYPTVEFAILYHPEREGIGKNPTKLWRNWFYESKVRNKAIHLCGRTAVDRFIKQDEQLWEELEQVNRVQLNIVPAPTDRIDRYINIGIQMIIHEEYGLEYVTQMNDWNKPFSDAFEVIDAHSYLFDGSLGTGVLPGQYQPPVPDKFCGYAGGLNPDNILSELQKINQVCDRPFWIDMETGVRTAGHDGHRYFDLNKVKQVLKAIYELPTT